jgi:hypothetical protein
VSNVRAATGNRKLVLDFAEVRTRALRAIVRPKNFGKFPDFSQLAGKRVYIYGIFADHEGRAEIEMTQIDQVKVVN